MRLAVTRWSLVTACVASVLVARPSVSFTTRRVLTRQRHDNIQVSYGLYANSKKNLSASEKEKRDEEERRRRRKDDVVIGKTSAKKGETDFALDPKATEEEYLRQASIVEQEVFRLTETGMEFLNSVRTEKVNSICTRYRLSLPDICVVDCGRVAPT